ncbi:hypothetical protein P691DRAFT_713352, partial [Macrolepiota fuliginosa MF-IS2]
MVKRPKSPEPVEDSKFLAVVHPFPLNANMEIPNDFKEFMYWLASVVGKDYALSAYYKPSARGMVVAEVSKTFPNFDALLGEHRWVQFLQKASNEERERRTQVYYSTYSNGRALQKDGWKCLFADDALFSDFRPVNRKIKNPYPPTLWCDVPYEDPTNKVLCRPLPVATKAPPPRAPAPIPGSTGWISQRAGGQPLGAAFADKKGGPSKGGPAPAQLKGKGKSPMNPDAWRTPIMAKSPSTSSAPTANNTNLPSKSSWGKPLAPATASTALNTTVPSPRSASPVSATTTTEDTASTTTSVSPPSTISRALTSPPPGLVPPALTGGRPANPRGSSSIIMLQGQFASPTSPTSPAALSATSSMGGASLVLAAASDFDSEEWSGGDDDDGFEFPSASAVTPRDELAAPRTGRGQGKGKYSSGNVNAKENHSENLWSKVPVTAGRTFRKVIEEDEICPVHGVVCSKGICSVMKKKKRDKENATKRAEREKERAKRKKAKNESRGGGPEEKSVEDDDEAGDDDENEEAKSVSEAAPSVVGSVSPSKKGSEVPTVFTAPRRGNWGPAKARNAKRKGNENASAQATDQDDGAESIVISSARPNSSIKSAPSVASAYAASTGSKSAIRPSGAATVASSTIGTGARSPLASEWGASAPPSVSAAWASASASVAGSATGSSAVSAPATQWGAPPGLPASDSIRSDVTVTTNETGVWSRGGLSGKGGA